jgi:hypothetical protein
MTYPIAMELAVVLACAVIGLVLYVLVARRGANGHAPRERKDDLVRDGPQSTAERTPVAQSDTSENIRLVSEIPSVAHGAVMTDAAEAGRTAVAKHGTSETREIQPTAARTDEPSEIEPHLEANRPQGLIVTQKGNRSEKPTVSETITFVKNGSARQIERPGGALGETLIGPGNRPLEKPAHINPEKRGGRSRAGDRRSEKEQTNKGRPRNPKPEIVCWKRDREWVLAVEIPEELRTISVSQNGIRLTEDNLKQGYWRLATLGGEVVVSVLENESECQSKVVLGDNNYLVFKLSGVEQNQGRHVKQPTYGSYLVVVLADWQRDEVLAGPAPAEPEDVCLQSYRAHFFNLGANQQR